MILFIRTVSLRPQESTVELNNPAVTREKLICATDKVYRILYLRILVNKPPDIVGAKL